MATVGNVIDLASPSNDTRNSASSQSNPWPYLDKHFEFKLKKEKSLKFVCQLCLPKHTEICVYISFPLNLQKHVKSNSVGLLIM